MKTHRGVGDGGETDWDRELLPGLELKWGLIFPENINLKTRAFNGPAETNDGVNMTNRVLASDFRKKPGASR